MKILLKNSTLTIAKREDLPKNSGTQLVRKDDAPCESGFTYLDYSKERPAAEEGYRHKRKLTATYYGWERVKIEVIEPTAEETTQAALKAWWASLTVSEQSSIYTHAPNALLAWERKETEVMIQLILSNEAQELTELKSQIQAML